jgi:hypothetical protein
MSASSIRPWMQWSTPDASDQWTWLIIAANT